MSKSSLACVFKIFWLHAWKKKASFYVLESCEEGHNLILTKCELGNGLGIWKKQKMVATHRWLGCKTGGERIITMSLASNLLRNGPVMYHALILKLLFRVSRADKQNQYIKETRNSLTTRLTLCMSVVFLSWGFLQESLHQTQRCYWHTKG